MLCNVRVPAPRRSGTGPMHSCMCINTVHDRPHAAGSPEGWSAWRSLYGMTNSLLGLVVLGGLAPSPSYFGAYTSTFGAHAEQPSALAARTTTST